jgi:hypothetical protein
VVTSERSAPRVLLLVCCALLIWTMSCSSSKSTPPPGFQFVTPSSSPTIDLGESINLTVNQSATFSLQSGCGYGNVPGTFAGGAKTATGTTATYVAPLPSGNPPPACPQGGVPVIVVATTSSNQTATLTVNLATTPVSINTSASAISSYAGVGCNGTPCCPPAGTLIPPPTSNGLSTMRVNTFESLGPTIAQGGVPPYTWQLTSGSLPTGLQLEPSTDTTQLTISGTTGGTAGCSNFTLQIFDSTATSNCNWQTSNACSQPMPFYFVVVPSPPNVQTPNYPSAFNDSQNGNRGVPYPPIALVASGTQQPYFWCESPIAGFGGDPGSTLPTGLVMNFPGQNPQQQSQFTCNPTATNTAGNTAISTQGVEVISGTTSSGIDSQENSSSPCIGNGPVPGCYNTEFLVYDSQVPYPGVTLVTLGKMEDVPLVRCSQANQAPLLNQGQLNPDAFLVGPVAFMLRGFDAGGPVAIAGSVTLGPQSPGSSTFIVQSGTVDITRSSGHRQLIVQSAGSWYVIGDSSFNVGQFGVGGPGIFDYSRGCMFLSLSDSQGSLPLALNFTLSGCTNHNATNGVTSTSSTGCLDINVNPPSAGTFTAGHIIEFDDNTGTGTRASGILRVQDSSSFSSGLSGPYAFGLSGGDSVGQRFAMAGSLQANSGSLTSIAADVNDGGTCTNPTCNVNTTGGSGTYTADPNFGSSNGRWSGTLSVSSQSSFGVAIYAISANEAIVTTTDQLAAGHPIIGGEAITTASSFDTMSLQNSHMFHIGGLATAGPDVSIGVLSFDGAGTITGGTVYQDQAATLGTTQVSGVYQVDPNGGSQTGRVIFSAPNQGQTLGAHPFVAYIIPQPATRTRTDCSTSPAACVTGFLVGTDNTAQGGILEFQTPITAPPPPFINLYVAGNYAYGTDESQDPLTANLEGDVFGVPNGTSTTGGSLGSATEPFFQDVSYADTNYFCHSSICYLLQTSQQLSGSYSVTQNGTGTFGGGVVSVTNGNVTFFIDESPVNKHPSVTVAEQ